MEDQKYIVVKGGSENNLKNIDVKIPKYQLTVFTGISGSGKTSLVMDTIAKEARRQLFSTFSTFIRAKMDKLNKPKFEEIHGLSAVIKIDQKRISGNSRSTVGTITELYDHVRLLYSRCGLPQIGDSTSFSFNVPEGMCVNCKGLGVEVKFEKDSILDDSLSLNEGGIIHPDFKVKNIYFKVIKKSGFFDMDKKLCDFTEEEMNKLLYSPKIRIESQKNDIISLQYEGIITSLNRRYLKREQNRNEKYLTKVTCSECKGCRLSKKAREVTYRGKTIHEMSNMEIRHLYKFFEGVLKTETIDMERKLIGELLKRMENIVNLGIGYLSLSRHTSTLSGGESQRIKISKQLNCSLTDMIYILDEPTIGLHVIQVESLIEMLKKLRDNGNTVLVIEHDMRVLNSADYVVEIGPKSGANGGELVFQGAIDEFKKKNTLTGKYYKDFLDNEMVDEGEESSDDDDEDEDDIDYDDDEMNVVMEDEDEEDEFGRKKFTEFYEIVNANVNNLQNVTVKIPKGVFTAVSGVAGSGKSTLIVEVFAKLFKEAIVVNQFKIGRTSRSNPATYTGVFDNIRKIFAKKADKKPGFFSFNSKGGCKTCKDDSETVCNDCKGKRYSDDVLQYTYKDKTITDVLEMTIDEGVEFFKKKKEIKKKLRCLIDCGLGYLTLGQSLSTLSGGEAQRIKLSSQISKKGSIFILDEPSLGLHSYDIEKLMKIIKKLVQKDNTVIVVEHNLDVVKEADYVIDLGLGGGSEGGKILAYGTPEEFVKKGKGITHTAKFLKRVISKKRKRVSHGDDDEDEEFGVETKKRKKK